MLYIEKTKTSFPISLNDAKIHLRVSASYHDDDDYINALIESATLQCENYISKDIALTSCVAKYYDWGGDKFTVEEGNFVSTDYVISDTSTLLGVKVSKNYVNYFTIELNSSFSSTSETEPVEVQFTTGYSSCPADIKQAILMKIGDLYDVDRQNYVEGIRFTNAGNRILNSYKLIIF